MMFIRRKSFAVFCIITATSPSSSVFAKKKKKTKACSNKNSKGICAQKDKCCAKVGDEGDIVCETAFLPDLEVTNPACTVQKCDKSNPAGFCRSRKKTGKQQCCATSGKGGKVGCESAFVSSVGTNPTCNVDVCSRSNPAGSCPQTSDGKDQCCATAGLVEGAFTCKTAFFESGLYNPTCIVDECGKTNPNGLCPTTNIGIGERQCCVKFGGSDDDFECSSICGGN